MSRFQSPLHHVRVAAPCTADWERMIGTERVRFCGQCSLNVYNLSGMTKREAEQLVTSAEGRLCIRFYRRADGTILTKNCPVGLTAIKRRISRVTRATLSAVLSFFAGLGVYFGLRETPQVSSVTMGVIAARPITAVAGRMETNEIPINQTEEGQMDTVGEIVKPEPLKPRKRFRR